MTKPVWGVPWHGRIQGGLMYLPNGTTRTWRQPIGPTTSRRYEYGFTFGQKLAGVPEVERSAEELAADALAGHEWRNEFIVTGTDDLGSTTLEMSVANTRVGGWIYQDPNGKRWRLRMGGRYSFTQGNSLTIPYSLRKFGAFGEPNETFTPPSIVMTSAAMGQLTPALTGSTTRYARVIDISKTGDKAILSIINADDQTIPVAIGFLMITFAGVPGVNFTATPTTLYTREQTVGTIVNDQPVTGNTLGFLGHLFNESTEDNTAPAPTCGYIDSISTPYAPPQDVADPPGVSLARRQYASGTNRLAVTGRVLAVWFNDAGEPEPLRFDSEQVYTVNKVWQPATLSGRYVYRETRSGPFCGTQTYSTVEEMTASIDEAFQQTWLKKIRIYRGGEEKTIEMSRFHNYRKAGSGTGSGKSNPIAWRVSSGQLTDTQEVKFNGVVTQTKDESAPITSFNYSTVDPKVEIFPLVTRNLMPGNFDLNNGSSKYITGYAATSFRYWSNNIAGLLGVYTGAGAGNNINPEATAGFSPAGILEPAAGSLYYFYFGAWNPVTGEAIWPSETAVSWA